MNRTVPLSCSGWKDTVSGQWRLCLSPGYPTLPPSTFGPSAQHASESELRCLRSAGAGSVGDDAVKRFFPHL